VTSAPEGRLWLAETLWKLGSIQFGDFTLGRTVRNSPVYVNAKLLISRPDAMVRISKLIEDELLLGLTRRNQQFAAFDAIAGVPIGGLHVATALSLEMRVPLLYIRGARHEDEIGTPHIEGIYRPGQTAIIVDDLAAGGGSLVETALLLRQAGLIVQDAVVLLDREQGAERRLQELGVRLHPLLTLEVLLTYLTEAHHVSRDDFERTIAYLRSEGEPRSEFE
jgi:orotate phosphoribosyltransferase